MARPRRQPLGSAPAVHVKGAKRSLNVAESAADRVVRALDGNVSRQDCSTAFDALTAALQRVGAAKAHEGSTGKSQGELFGAKEVERKIKVAEGLFKRACLRPPPTGAK